MRAWRQQRGFTLVELMIAMTILALMSLSIYGVVAIGARSAGAGERKTEQARRLRVATDVMVRQLRSTVPIPLSTDGEIKNFFVGTQDLVEFVTSAPQRPDASGLSLVTYWVEDGQLRMSEVPLFTITDTEDIDYRDPLVLSTVLLYDVDSISFAYRRNPNRSGEWQTEWDADEEDDLPATVQIQITPATADGPAWLHSVPLFVGVLNEITGESDFRGVRRIRARRASDDNQDGQGDEPDDEPDEDLDE